MSSLKRDKLTVPGLAWACLSYVGNLDGNWVRPAPGATHSEFLIKIRGAFGTREEAEEHAKALQEVDNLIDIYVVNLYEWLLLPPPSSADMENVNYQDERLDAVMKGYRENQKHAAMLFEKRKEDMIAEASGSEMPYIEPGDENSKYYTKPDEAPIPHPSEFLETFKKDYPDKTEEELVKMADDAVQAVIEQRKKTIEKGKSVI